MEILQFNNVNKAFHCTCLLVTMIYGITSVCDFLQNLDLTTITFKAFHNDAESIYPSISMCFNTPFMKNRLIHSEQLFQPIEYTKYLIGRAPANETLRSINFDDVSFQTKDFLIKVYIKFMNKLAFARAANLLQLIAGTPYKLLQTYFAPHTNTLIGCILHLIFR